MPRVRNPLPPLLSSTFGLFPRVSPVPVPVPFTVPGSVLIQFYGSLVLNELISALPDINSIRGLRPLIIPWFGWPTANKLHTGADSGAGADSRQELTPGRRRTPGRGRTLGRVQTLGRD